MGKIKEEDFNTSARVLVAGIVCREDGTYDETADDHINPRDQAHGFSRGYVVVEDGKALPDSAMYSPTTETASIRGTAMMFRYFSPLKPTAAVANMTTPQRMTDAGMGNEMPKEASSNPEKAAPQILALMANHPMVQMAQTEDMSH